MYLSPFHMSCGIILVIILMVIGLFGFFLLPSLRQRVTGLPHFDWLPDNLQPAVMPLFALLWTVPLAVPFVSMIQYMPVRCLHTPGYGPWFVMAPGFVFGLSLLLSFVNTRTRQYLTAFIILCIVTWSGIQHTAYAEKSYRSGNRYWNSIKQSLSDITFPPQSDIVITNARIGVHSNYPTCTGQFAQVVSVCGL